MHRIYADGREYVFTTSNKYDLIFSEPSNPYRAGVAALYTTEFYEAARQRLNPGGIFVQWLQAYEVDDAAVLTVLKTARAAFNHVEVWQTMGVDLQLVCSDTPIVYSADELRARIGSGAVQEALAKTWYVDDLEGFMAHFVASSQYVDAVAQVPLVELNTDDRTILEYSFAKTVGHRTPFSIEILRDRLKGAGFHRPQVEGKLDWNRVEIRRQISNLVLSGELSYALLPQAADQSLVEALNRFRNGDFAGAVHVWPAEYRNPTDPLLRLLLARAYAEQRRPECLDLVSPAQQRYPIDSAAIRAIYYCRSNNIAQAAKALDAYFSLLADSPWLLSAISEMPFTEAVDVAHSDKTAAQRLYSLLSRQFASDRINYARQRARVLVAAELGPSEVVEALAELEPHIPWIADILKLRGHICDGQTSAGRACPARLAMVPGSSEVQVGFRFQPFLRASGMSIQ